MKKQLLNYALIFILLTLASVSKAENIDYPPVIQNLKDSNGFSIVKKFRAVSGLTGWVVKDGVKNQYSVIYSTQDGQSIVAGLLIDSKGNNLTKTYADKYLPKTTE